MPYRKTAAVSAASRLSGSVRSRKYAAKKRDADADLLGIGSRAGGAQVLASLAGGTPEQAGIGIARLLAFARIETGALACGLFRVIPGTGLLIPVGSIACDPAQKASDREQIERLMARAADQAAFLLLNSREALMPQRMHRRRTTAAGKYVLWSNAIIGIAERTELEASAGADREAILSGNSGEGGGGGALPSSRYAQPQLLGIWVSVSHSHLEQTSPFNDEQGEPGSRLHLQLLRPAPLLDQEKRHQRNLAVATSKALFNAASERVHPLFQLALQQNALRESTLTARRQSEKRLREVAAIHDIGSAIGNIEPQALFNLITQKASDVMDAQACSLMLMTGMSEQMSIAAAHGLPEDVVQNARVLVGEGIAGRVAQTGEAMLVQSDARNDPRLRGTRGVGLPGIASSITVPMFDDNRRVNGVLCIRRRTPAPPFSEDDKRLFSIFANQASQAIKNARLYRELRSRVHELSTLASLTETISSTLDLQFVLNKVADSTIELVGFDRCMLYLRDASADDEAGDADANAARPEVSDAAGEGNEYSVCIARGFEAENLCRLPAGELVHAVGARQVPVLMEDGDETLPIAVEYARSLGMTSFYAQPLIVRDRTIGVLVVSNDVSHRLIAYSNLDLLSTFLQHAALAIDNARLHAQTERRVRELHSLYTMSQSLTTTYGLSRACATVARVARDVAAADFGLIMLFNDRLDRLGIREVQGLPPELETPIRQLQDCAEVSAAARALREPHDVEKPANAPLFGPRWRAELSKLRAVYPHLLLVPLVTEDTAVGYILLGRAASGGAFAPDAVKLVSIISSQAGAVLRGAALYEQSVDERVLELSALNDLSTKVRGARSLTGALEGILEIVASVIWCDISEIYTVDPDRRMLVRQVSRGEAESSAELGFDEKSIPSWVMCERKALLIADIAADQNFADYVPAGGGGKSLMAIPVIVGDEVFAVLQVQASVSGLYNEDNVKMLSLIAAQAAALFRDMESLRELTSYTDNILRSIAAAVVTLDAQGNIVTFNQAAERVLRVPQGEIVGAPLNKLLARLESAEADREDVHKMVARAVETGQIIQCHRLQLYTVEGERAADPVIVNGSASQLLSERGDYLGVVLVFEDITKEDEMEQELDRISRLAEIGQLAAGIAHELRNPLASIKGAAQVLLGDLSPELVERHGEFLDIIVSEVDGLNAVTSEFLEFSRPAPLSLKTTDLNALLARRIAFMAAEFAAMDVSVEQYLDPTMPQIQADAAQLERVFVNLILNAAQAMTEGGVLTITTEQVTPTAVEIRFGDTGHGIPAGRVKKIFTPFFTTKTKGTGLGLPIVQKIIDAHGGHIRVDSEVEVGTTFTIYLPISNPYFERFRVQDAVQSAEIADQRREAAKRLPVQPLIIGGGEEAPASELDSLEKLLGGEVSAPAAGPKPRRSRK